MKSLYKVFLFSWALSLTLSTSAQTIENIKAVAQGTKIIVTFDIKDPKPGQNSYNIQLFSSHDSFAAPLTFIKGDVGNEVKPGAGKRIEWEAGEIGNFTGELTFEIRGEIVASWMFKSPTGGSLTKGKPATIQWQGGKPDDNVKIEVVKDGKTTPVGEGKNTGQMSWLVPKDLEKGGGYQLKLTAKGNTITSDLFAVKNKMPIWMIVAPIALVGGLVAVLAGGGGGDGGTPPPDDSGNLPEPPDPN